MATQTCFRNLLACTSKIVAQERGNAWRASLGKISRRDYLHRYQVKFVQPDGSTIVVPASEPRQTFQSAIDLKQLSDDERRQRLAARKPKAKVVKQETIDDNFDENQYMKFWATQTEIPQKSSKK